MSKSSSSVGRGEAVADVPFAGRVVANGHYTVTLDCAAKLVSRGFEPRSSEDRTRIEAYQRTAARAAAK